MKNVFNGSWKLLAMMVFVVTFSACNDDDGDILEPDRLSSAEFVQRAAASDMFEIETGEMAEDMAEREDVRTFGQMIVNDHTESSTILMAMANQKNLPVPTALPQDKMEMRNRLAGMTGTEFDMEFMTQQVAAHQEAVALYEQAEDELQDTELRNFAAATLPVLREHLEHAQMLRDALD
ncbi:DUF4142 domain-containing protein [Pontibacter sp. SGAir0037]|uniref:DUF4142 domain-containing protein n=1 Tax=Pontibacter sp. SGAir0037 TaxID=2571030 RepID=UPI0010CD3A15|nr:DUF4142 domain-containing protein [Pontibacter sp. SGAir0037]QCR21720.1 DUF305 domain-containing protein [Pontibacter sp. SGAir0037]